MDQINQTNGTNGHVDVADQPKANGTHQEPTENTTTDDGLIEKQSPSDPKLMALMEKLMIQIKNDFEGRIDEKKLAKSMARFNGSSGKILRGFKQKADVHIGSYLKSELQEVKSEEAKQQLTDEISAKIVEATAVTVERINRFKSIEDELDGVNGKLNQIREQKKLLDGTLDVFTPDNHQNGSDGDHEDPETSTDHKRDHNDNRLRHLAESTKIIITEYQELMGTLN